MISSLLGLLFASPLFLAQPVAGLEKRLAVTAFTQTTCRTYLTTKSTTATTSTASLVLNLDPIVLYTETPSTTLTPQATTTTTTTTFTATTTASVVTDTFSTTTTIIVSTTEIDTITISQTETDTVTSTAATTSTVPIPNGFIFPTPTAGGKKRGLSPAVQAIDMVKKSSGTLEARDAAAMSLRCKGAKSKYPYKVACTQIVESIKPITFTLTAKQTTTITAPVPTSTITASTTITTTIYEPDASVTSTFSETDTVTSTVLATETQSQTVTSTVTYQPTSTYYAQCGAQNQVSTDLSGSLLTLVTDSGTANQVFYTVDAYSCCAACATTANCAGSNWIPSLGSENCELNIFNSCPANQGQLADEYGTSSAVPVTLSNGNCGYFLYQS
ncbi:hypothetical protein KCU93_g6916, partial [Aureobasidium melanogenum]